MKQNISKVIFLNISIPSVVIEDENIANKFTEPGCFSLLHDIFSDVEKNNILEYGFTECWVIFDNIKKEFIAAYIIRDYVFSSEIRSEKLFYQQ